MNYHPEAEQLNQIIKARTPVIYDLLSKNGRNIFFPKRGIFGQTAEAKGKEINATVGVALEDDNSPMRLSMIRNKVSLDLNEIFPYASSYGKLELRQYWQKLIRKKNPSLEKEISLPVVGNGATHSLSIAAFMFINPGEEVIISDKFWGNYNLIFKNFYGSKFNQFNTFKNDGFDIEAMREKLLEKGEKKVLSLNFPNNPSGYNPTNEEAERIIEVIKEAADKGKKIVVLNDDAYFGLVYKDGIYKESLFAKLSNLHKNVLAVKIDCATKEYFAWGLRVGFITFGHKDADQEIYAALESKAAGTVRANISNASNVSQSLVYQIFVDKKYKKEKEVKDSTLKERCLEVEKVLKKNEEKYSEYFNPLPFNSGYFMCVELKNLDTEKVRQTLLENYSTGVISIDNLLRIAYSSVPVSQIEKMFENIYKACKTVAKNS